MALLKTLIALPHFDVAITAPAQNYLRPRNAEAAKKHAETFPMLKTVGIDEFGGWQLAQKTHFNDGGMFDRVIATAGKK